MDRNISQNEVIAIHCQLLRALLSANIPFSKVIKLFRILQSSYNLSSRKQISTKILNQVHQEVEHKIQEFVTDAKFLTLSGDGWTNVSKQSMVNFILTNEKRQSQIWKSKTFQIFIILEILCLKHIKKLKQSLKLINKQDLYLIIDQIWLKHNVLYVK